MRHRTLIVARIQPGTEEAVARIFTESDATSLPHDVGVTRRSLYAFEDVYLHLIDLSRDPRDSLRAARELPAFRQISDDLSSYIRPYNPVTWRTPQDAVATEFYNWSAVG